MLQSVPINNFEGFGNGSKLTVGEYIHSQGMKKTQNGISPGWIVTSTVDDSTLTGLGLINWFSQATPDGSTMSIYAVDANGVIYDNQNALGVWALAYKPGVTTFGNGLIGDQLNKLLYLTTQYLGKYDGTANYTTGTIAVTNGSANVVGTGTTFTSGMVNKRIVINGVWYTISAFTDATHITLSSNYAGSTASGLSYAIYVGWDDRFKDFGSSSLAATDDFRDSDRYEDFVVITNGNKLALFNVTDNSFNASAFTLPSGYKARCVKVGRTGILTGANVGNRSILFLWDAYSDRSIAPWIPINANVQSIVWDDISGYWIVVTNRKVYKTDGYSIQELAPLPDTQVDGSYLSVLPQGTAIIGEYLVMLNTSNNTNRLRSGVWLLNLRTLLWEYSPVSNGGTYNNSMRAIFFDSVFTVNVGWTTSKPARNNIGSLRNIAPSNSYYIFGPLGEGNNEKVAQGVKVNLGLSPLLTSTFLLSFDISVKIYAYKRQLWGYAQQKTTAGATNQITVNGTLSGFNNAQVGDEIMVMEGVNAGKTAHITAISGQDTSTEVWTLDTNLPGLTETNVFIQVMPFKLVRKYSFSNITKLKDLYFNVKNRYRGKKFAVKILIENVVNTPPEIIGADLIYDDLGALTSN